MKLNTKDTLFGIAVLIVVGLIVIQIYQIVNSGLSLSNASVENSTPTNQSVTAQQELEVPNIKKADKIEIVNFHATQRCYSCTTLGQLSEKTIKEKFANETTSGTIVFKAINVDLPENKEIVELYQAGGSSLYINAIKNDKNNIVQNVKVWQFIGDEGAFTNYLETIVRSLL